MLFISPTPAPRLWGAGPVDDVHIDLTAVKGERLQRCDAWRIAELSFGEVLPPPSLPGL